MEREGIYVGTKEVTQRYIGSRLVWKKMKLLFSGDISINYFRDSSQIILNRDFSQSTIKDLEINGQKIPFSRAENKQNQFYITFSESVEKFEQKTGFNRYRTFYGSIPVKIYGYGG
nr:MAG TPA: hypothetical protein [Caudoviricetes sp.]